MTIMALLATGGLVAIAYVVLLRRSGTTVRSPGRQVVSAPRPVSLRAVIDRLASVGDEESVLIDRPSGRFVTLGDQLLALLDGDDPVDELIDDTIAFTESQLEELRGKLRAKKLLPLPTKVDTREFQLRERFCGELPDGETKDEMQKVLRGQTGYRSFDGAVTRLHIADQWERFRDAGFSIVATEWLQRHEIPFTRDFVTTETPPALRQAG